MPTTIPQIPPPQQSKEVHQSKATVRGKKEDSFREVLDGAKEQAKPKQKEPKATEAAAEKAAEAPAVDDEASFDAEAGTEEVVEKRPAPRRKEKPQKSEGSEVEELAQTGEAAVLTPAVPFDVRIDLAILDDAAAAVGPEQATEAAVPPDLVTTEDLLSCIPPSCRQAVETPNVETETATAHSDVEAPVLDLRKNVIAEVTPEKTEDHAPVIPDAAEAGDVRGISIAPEAMIEDAEELSVPVPDAGRRLPKAPMDSVDGSVSPEHTPVASQDPLLPQGQYEGHEQPSGKRDAPGTESSSQGTKAHAPVSFSTTIAEVASPQAVDPTTVPVAPKPDQPPAMKIVSAPAAPVADALEARFDEANHPRIVTAVQAELMPSGGTVRLRLDPPELGALQVRIDVKDGVLAASFQTSNDEATRLLSRSLQQLKATLESHGVTVEKLHVQQTREQWDGGRNSEDRQQHSPQHWQQQEQQRREMLQRMWRRVRDGRDPFDLVA